MSLSAEAVSQLVGAHREFLAFVERRVESRAAAEDILQAAFVKGLEKGAPVDDEKVVAWFYRVLRNSVIDYYRSRGATSRALEKWQRDFAQSEVAPAEVEEEICRCITELMSGLKPEYRDALELVDMQDGKLTDLAVKAGITAENAAVRIHRARKALRSQVEKACGTCAEHGCVDCQCGSGC
jgi:RNA polymerase sigma-70 factor (ECF subfamily)